MRLALPKQAVKSVDNPDGAAHLTRAYARGMAFTGFPEAALDFYDDLEVDNTKAFFVEHRATYDEAVAAPMRALVAELEDEFGPAKLFRPYRDVRFAKDKTPYKTHQGAFVAATPSAGWYVQVGAPGVRVSTGLFHTEAPALAAFRAAVDHDRHGPELARIVRRLERSGWEVGGDRLATSPRGWSADHPRIDLLRHRTLSVGQDLGVDPVIHTPDLVERVRGLWRETTPLVRWAVRHTAT